MKEFWKKLISLPWGGILLGFVLLLAGVAFLLIPARGFDLTWRIAGIAVALAAVFYIVVTVATGKSGARVIMDLLMGGVALAFGVVLIFAAKSLMPFFLYALGLYLVVDGSFQLHTATLSRKYKSWSWWGMLLISLTLIGLGVYLMNLLDVTHLAEETLDYSDGNMTVVRLMGTGLVVDGVGRLLSLVSRAGIRRGQRREVEDDLREKGLLITLETVGAPDGAATLAEPATPRVEDKSRGGKKLGKAKKNKALPEKTQEQAPLVLPPPEDAQQE